ncbi:MAG: PA2169 family four-helix-bundle protein [Verrucomicrobiota bacterium]
MNALQVETVAVLRGLADVCREGQNGFREASECTSSDPELKMLLSSFSVQTGKFASELHTQIRSISGGAVEPPSAAHADWAQFEPGTRREDNHLIVAACEEYADRAMAEYNKAVAHDLESPAREIVQRQRQEVITMHHSLRTLRDRVEPGLAESARAAGASISETAGEMWKDVQSQAEGFTSKAGAKAEELKEKASATAEDLKAKSEQAVEATREYVRRNPVPILTGGLILGFLIGLFFYAMELRNDQIRLEIRRSPWRRMGNTLAGWIGYITGRAKSQYESSAEAVRDFEMPTLRRRNWLMRKIGL